MTSQNAIAARARRHLDDRLGQIRGKDVFARPPKGWLRAIRDALGLTSRQFAKRAGVSQSTAYAWETAEAADSITLGKLREAAAALDCELVYALVPKTPLEATVQARAGQLADAQLSRIHHTMALESQSLQKRELERERERLIETILLSKPSRLWEGE